MTARNVLVRAWQVRPTGMEWAVIVIVVCLANLLFGAPFLLAAVAAFALVTVAAVLTAVDELKFGTDEADRPAKVTMTKEPPR